MRKKLREIMDKEEGFTLVELLAVIAILAIIVAIAVPAVGNVISNSNKKADDAEEELVKDAARIYFTAESKEITNGLKVSVDTLVEKNYLELDDSEDDLFGKEVVVEVTPAEGVTKASTKYVLKSKSE